MKKSALAIAFSSILFSLTSHANTHKIEIDGYYLDCRNISSIQKKENNTWVETITHLPHDGMYVLDGKYIGPGMCDNILCHKLEKPYSVDLIEYISLSKQPAPADSGRTHDSMVDAFRTSPLTGEIKITVDYFEDGECKVPKSYSEVVVVTN